MPRSKRAKVVSLTKTDKRSTRSAKGVIIEEIRSNLDQWKYVWVLSVGNMRNAALKDIRNLWKGTGRLFFARSKVMAKALGTTSEEEQKPSLHEVGQKLSGQIGLFFTSSPPGEVIEWFRSFSKPDFARSGNVATKEVVLPEGPVVMYNDAESPFPSSMEPQLRKLGLSTKLVKGVPTLSVPQAVCRNGDILTPEQAQLLKLIGEKLSVFKVRLAGHWSEDGGWVEVDGMPNADDAPSDVDDDGMDDID